MPQVTVKDFAHLDVRLRVAGRLLKMNHERVGWRLIQLWSLATAQNSPIMTRTLTAEAIGRKSDDVARALTTAQLAEPVGGERLDLSPMQSLFGDCNWLHKNKGGASAGGQARAATAGRAPDGTFTSASRGQSLHDRVLEQLRAARHTREQLRAALHCRNSDMLHAVNELIDDGVVVDEDGQLSLAPGMAPIPESTEDPGTAFPDSHGNRPVPGPIPGIDHAESGIETQRESASRNPEPEPSSALALAPALAPAHTGAREGTGNRESAESLLASDLVVPEHQSRPVARLLWEYQNRCRAELNPDAPPLPLNDVPGGTLDAVVRRLVTYSPSQCRHALDMFKLEGKHLRDSGENPLQYLNGFTNWKHEPLGRRVGTTADAVAQEARARKAERRKSSANETQLPRRKRLN